MLHTVYKIQQFITFFIKLNWLSQFKTLVTSLIAITLLLSLTGCGRKYHPPVLPYTTAVEKIADNDVAIIRQGSLMEQDLEHFICGAPPTMRAATVELENKTNKPLIVEIDTSNVSIYDTEDLAHICSKEALHNSNKSNFSIGHSIGRNLVQICSSFVAISWLAYASSIRFDNIAPLAKMGIIWLPAIGIFALGSYINKSITAHNNSILEDEEDRFFEKYHQMFEHSTLAFDYSVEVAPHDKLKQIIFFDSEPAKSGSGGQRILVLRLTKDNQQTLVPLEL